VVIYLLFIYFNKYKYNNFYYKFKLFLLQIFNNFFDVVSLAGSLAIPRGDFSIKWWS